MLAPLPIIIAPPKSGFSFLCENIRIIYDIVLRYVSIFMRTKITGLNMLMIIHCLDCKLLCWTLSISPQFPNYQIKYVSLILLVARSLSFWSMVRAPLVEFVRVKHWSYPFTLLPYNLKFVLSPLSTTWVALFSLACSGYLRQNLGSLRYLLVAIAFVIEIVSYPIQLCWGTVVILNLVIHDKQCRKMVGKFGQENMLGISFEKPNGILMRISNNPFFNCM